MNYKVKNNNRINLHNVKYQLFNEYKIKYKC